MAIGCAHDEEGRAARRRRRAPRADPGARARRAPRGATDQAVGPELRRRRQHGAQDRPHRRGGPARRRRRGRTGPGFAHPRAAAGRQARHGRRGGPAARGGPRADRAVAPAGERRQAAPRRGRRAHHHEAPGPRPDGPRRQPALQHLGAGRAVLPAALPDDRAGPRHGAARGRGAARGQAGKQDLRRTQPQGRVVRRRRARRARGSQRLLARAQRGLWPGGPAAAQAPEDHGQPRRGLPLHRRGVPPATQGAARCARVMGRLPGRRGTGPPRRRRRPADPW